jgi:hypothetical protein
MKKYEDPSFEFRVRDIAAADRVSSRLPRTSPGVLVDAVREGGWAALGHLADGDMLLTIDGDRRRRRGRPAQDGAEWRRPGRGPVVFKVRRGFERSSSSWKPAGDRRCDGGPQALHGQYRQHGSVDPTL